MAIQNTKDSSYMSFSAKFKNKIIVYYINYYETIFMIESMICSLGTIIIQILPDSLFFWIILDRHSCLMLITWNKKNSITVLLEKYKDYKDNIKAASSDERALAPFRMLGGKYLHQIQSFTNLMCVPNVVSLRTTLALQKQPAVSWQNIRNHKPPQPRHSTKSQGLNNI